MQSEFQGAVESVRDQLRQSLGARLQKMHAEFELALVEFWNEIPRRVASEDSGKLTLSPVPLVNVFEPFVACFEELGFAASLEPLKATLGVLELAQGPPAAARPSPEAGPGGPGAGGPGAGGPGAGGPGAEAGEKKAVERPAKEGGQGPKGGSGMFSKIKGLISKKGENIPEADLDDNVKSHYDPVKKRWIFEGEPEEEEAPLAPPPKRSQAKPEAAQAAGAPAEPAAAPGGKAAQISSLIKPPDRRKAPKKAPTTAAPALVQPPVPTIVPAPAPPSPEAPPGFWQNALGLFEPVLRQAERLATAEGESEALRAELQGLHRKQAEALRRSAREAEVVKNDVAQFAARWASAAEPRPRAEPASAGGAEEEAAVELGLPELDPSLLEEEARLLREFDLLARELEQACVSVEGPADLARLPLDIDPFVRCALKEPQRDAVTHCVELACDIVRESEQGGPRPAQLLQALETLLT